MSAAALRRAGAVLAAAWLGASAGLAFMTAPVLFRVLAHAEAGRAATRLFMVDACVGLVLGAGLTVLALRSGRDAAAQDVARIGPGASRFSTDMMLALGAVFCIVAGYFALQPMLDAARLDARAVPSFATLHVVAVAFFALKLGLVAALAWRLTGPALRPTRSSS